MFFILIELSQKEAEDSGRQVKILLQELHESMHGKGSFYQQLSFPCEDTGKFNF